MFSETIQTLLSQAFRPFAYGLALGLAVKIAYEMLTKPVQESRRADEKTTNKNLDRLHKLVEDLDNQWHRTNLIENLNLSEPQQALANLFGMKFEEIYSPYSPWNNPKQFNPIGERERTKELARDLINQCGDPRFTALWGKRELDAANEILTLMLIDATERLAVKKG